MYRNIIHQSEDYKCNKGFKFAESDCALDATGNPTDLCDDLLNLVCRNEESREVKTGEYEKCECKNSKYISLLSA